VTLAGHLERDDQQGQREAENGIAEAFDARNLASREHPPSAYSPNCRK
jgi:hypothetical protein